jgi:hypothetical protein
MFSKFTVALAAAAVAAIATVPTAASAGWHGHHHGHHGWYGGFYAPAYAAAVAPDCYVVRRVVYTPYGKRVRPVTVCN